MAVTSNDIANQAIQLMGDNQPPVTGVAPTFDTSTAGIALSKLYAPCVATVQRQWQWDASRSQVLLTLSGNSGPNQWTYEYLYPPNGIEVWQIFPPTNPANLTDPRPVNWLVGNSTVGGVQTKVIWANLNPAACFYNNNPSEATWDPLFREAVVRLLASELAIAIGGKPDTSQVLLESGAAMTTLGQGRPD